MKTLKQISLKALLLLFIIALASCNPQTLNEDADLQQIEKDNYEIPDNG